MYEEYDIIKMVIVMKVKGFKAFLPGLKTLEQDMKLEVGKSYHINQPIAFNQCGFHFCKRLEDTLHFFHRYGCPLDICEVIGYGNVKEDCHEYYGYYDMYVANNIEIIRKLSKIEILDMYKELLQNLYLYNQRIARFLQYYPELTEKDYEYLGISKGSFKLRYY